jgi:hypothetical protein
LCVFGDSIRFRTDESVVCPIPNNGTINLQSQPPFASGILTGTGALTNTGTIQGCGNISVGVVPRAVEIPVK